MGAMASQIIGRTIIYSTVYSGTDQRKHQSSALLTFVRGIHQWPVNFPHKWPVTRKILPFDDAIMEGSVLVIYFSLYFRESLSHLLTRGLFHNRFSTVIQTRWKVCSHRNCDRYEILHMAWQLCCYVVCKILYRYDSTQGSCTKIIFHRTWITMEGSFVKWAPDNIFQQDHHCHCMIFNLVSFNCLYILAMAGHQVSAKL